MNDQALSAGQYAVGLLWLAGTFGACGLAVFLALLRTRPELQGSSLWLARSLCFYGLLVAVHILPALIGILSRPAVLACSLLALAATRLVPASASEPARVDPDPQPAARSALTTAIAGTAGLLAGAYLLALFSGSAPNPVRTTDVATFDLPTVARWIQDQSIWEANDYSIYSSHGAYPHNTDLALLFFVLPFDSDFAARGSEILGLALAGLAAYALGRQLRTGRALATLAATAAITIPIVVSTTVELTMPDVYLYGPLLGGVCFLIRHARSGAKGDLLLAGVGLGLAFGGKWYGISSVIVVLAVWAGARWLAGGESRALLPRQSLTLAGLTAMFGGIWLVRNLAEYGNPLFPVSIPLLGFDNPVDPLRARAGDSLLNLLGDPGSIGSRGLDPLWQAFSLAGIVAAGGLLVALSRAPAARSGKATWLLPAVALAGIGISAAYIVTPYTAGPAESTTLAIVNSRYAVPGLMLGLVVLAAVARSWRAQQIAAIVLAATTTVSLIKGPDPALGRFAVAVVALAGIGAFVFAARAAASAALRARLRAGAAVLALLALAAGGYKLQQSHASNRLNTDPVLSAILESAPSGARIAIAGTWTTAGPPPVLAALGPRLENEVRYIGEERSSLLYPPATRADFLGRLESGNFDLVLVGLAGSGGPASWARALGPPLARSGRFELYPAPGTKIPG